MQQPQPQAQQQPQTQPQPMIPMMPSFSPTNITTEQIQKYLDENKKLILSILDNQNLGKLAECAQFQAQLQKNLMYLAAIADAQPQASTIPPQMAPHPALQQGAYYAQHPQAAAAMAQQPGLFPHKMPLQFNNPHQMQDRQQLHYAAIQGQMGMRPMGSNNGMHPVHAETNLGSSGPLTAPGSHDARGGSKQGHSDGGATGTDGHGGSAAGHRGDGSDDGK